MLRELHIKDFAIIDDLHLTLEPGFNILTGETGAGKSILIDAVTLILGGRADTTAIRTGAERARVEGLFLVSPLHQAILVPLLEAEELEGDEPDMIWLSRELRSNGRTVARVNGRVVPLGLMHEIGEKLVDVHGQSEHLSLLRISEHLMLLDRFAGLDALREQVSAVVHQIQATRHELRQLRQNERDRMQRIDMLRFQMDEIRSANLKVEEQTELDAELVRLTHAEQLSTLATELLALFEEGAEGEVSLLDLLGQGQRAMTALARIDATLAPQMQLLEEIGYQIEDLTRILRDYTNGIEYSPRRLTWVEERLSLLRRLERKYGGSLEEVLSYAQEASAELETLEHSDERISALTEQEKLLLSQCAELCQNLSEERQDAAVKLSKGIEVELNDLRMEGSRVGVNFTWQNSPDGLPLPARFPEGKTVTSTEVEVEVADAIDRAAFDSTGMDRVEFVVAPNVGEGLKPMARVASGGETARLMLAIKTVLSRADHTPTLIFDEIDQGIGGRVGAVVGAKLWRLTAGGEGEEVSRHQVLCITHLPQLAGFGDSHFRIQKHVTKGRTTTQAVHLDGEARITELSQMLGTQGEAARQSALQILEQADTVKKPKNETSS